MNRERAKELLPIIEHYANGGDVELRFKNDLARWCPFVGENVDKGFNPDRYEYRIAQVPDKFHNWDVLPPEFRRIVRDEDGRAYAIKCEPFGPDRNDGKWLYGYSVVDMPIRVDPLTCYERGTVDWKESLIERGESYETLDRT